MTEYIYCVNEYIHFAGGMGGGGGGGRGVKKCRHRKESCVTEYSHFPGGGGGGSKKKQTHKEKECD